MSDLKPCPFCGGKAEIIQRNRGVRNNPIKIINTYVAGCERCAVFTRYYESDIWQDEKGKVHIDSNGAELAAKAWNRRVNNE